MQELNVIQTPFYQWTLPDTLVDDCLSFVKDLNYHANGDVQTSDIFDFEPLTLFCALACQEVKNKFFVGQDRFNIVPTIFWANKTNFLGKHHKHAHSNSLYSGIIYLTENDNSGATRFYFPNIYKYFDNGFLNITDLSKKDDYFDVIPQKGKMIIFPSNIFHETLTNRNNLRITISFNTFLKGEIGAVDRKTILTL